MIAYLVVFITRAISCTRDHPIFANPIEIVDIGNAEFEYATYWNPFSSDPFYYEIGAKMFNFYGGRTVGSPPNAVRQLAAGQVGGGLQEVFWNGRNESGESVGSGIYLYRLEVGRENFTGKMVLVK